MKNSSKRQVIIISCYGFDKSLLKVVVNQVKKKKTSLDIIHLLLHFIHLFSVGLLSAHHWMMSGIQKGKKNKYPYPQLNEFHKGGGY